MSTEKKSPSTRILSIQSHVVSGYVGNRAATFPLQLLGHEVDVINTVQLSNHTGYNTFRGERFPASHILELFRGLQDNRLNDYSHLLVGYIGNSENIKAVEHIARELKPSMFVLDPVLGDDNTLYVPEELIAMYRDVLCPLADLVTPNQFEAELLTETKITSLSSAQLACDKLHKLGISRVVITSSVLSEKDALYLVGSELSSGGHKHQFYIKFSRLDGYFTGSGDFFAALTVARFIEAGSLARACELAMATMAGVMQETLRFQRQTGVVAPKDLKRGSRDADMVKGFELRIVPAQRLITKPELEFDAVTLPLL
ncbi:putative pyridoxal kinase [Coemansia spiralis]|uniref:pyridoxal kinase n=2 Tax=Coemansia TaxID=4863 RepID=A0A9W8FXS1_9FUNG|nr:pyridoxal kinase-like protein [Coemansia spiralis]KAJ1988945.1 putative pyridoxal kinase [Coemansia umbellata]KAJ2619931.1 putative pyridoxal kinase [Coemansia sp. RSA 1358]KAJ2670130.1 putative pyridoxal kinase [Coemansia spiralis]